MATDIQPGAVIEGKYRVLRCIGEGGMGTVYEGENIRIERRVAIKVLHEHVASSPEFAQRFEREARASARIGSPHVCDVLDLGDLENGERYIVMEFLDGESLEDRIAKGKMTASQVAPIAFEILEGLGTMHQAGVIHRDLKPANVFLARGRGARTESVKILDFGVAKILPRADEPGEMTSTGMMMGTPLYMSPEQARGARDVDGRTDLYAASVIFYRALTGEMPHAGLNLHELLFKIVLEDPRSIRDLVPDVDEVFAGIVTKGLARDADQRFASAREYQEAIAAWGAAQGRASLRFAVTLPTEPPPLRNISGGFPAAAVQKTQTPITGPTNRGEKVGPPTPAVAKTQTRTAAVTPSARQSGGTPTAWAEDAPEIAKHTLAELEAKRARKTSAGDTKILELAPATTPANQSNAPPPAPSPTSTPMPPRPQQGMRVAIGVGAVVVIAAAVLGMRLARNTSTNASTAIVGSASVPIVAPEPAVGVVMPPAAPATTSSPAETESATSPAASVTRAASSATARATTPPTATTTIATATKVAPVASSASPAKTAVPGVSVTSAPTAPASGHRKFRTNLE